MEIYKAYIVHTDLVLLVLCTSRVPAQVREVNLLGHRFNLQNVYSATTSTQVTSGLTRVMIGLTDHYPITASLVSMRSRHVPLIYAIKASICHSRDDFWIAYFSILFDLPETSNLISSIKLPFSLLF